MGQPSGLRSQAKVWEATNGERELGALLMPGQVAGFLPLFLGEPTLATVLMRGARQRPRRSTGDPGSVGDFSLPSLADDDPIARQLAADIPGQKEHHVSGTTDGQAAWKFLQGRPVDLVRQALEATEGNQVRAARLLGISRDALRNRMKKFGFYPSA